jgi:uncharacterized membrane protein
LLFIPQGSAVAVAVAFLLVIPEGDLLLLLPLPLVVIPEGDLPLPLLFGCHPRRGSAFARSRTTVASRPTLVKQP